MFSENLRKIMKNNNISNEELAKHLDCEVVYIENLLNDSLYPKSEDIMKIASFFKVKRDDLDNGLRRGRLKWNNINKFAIPQELYNKPIFVYSSANGKTMYVKYDGENFYTTLNISRKLKEKNYIDKNIVKYWSNPEDTDIGEKE